MIIECNINVNSKQLIIALFSIYRDFVGLQILQYYNAPFNRGFGLLNLAIGEHDFGKQMGISIKFLWWKWHWYKKGMNKNGQ